MSTLIKFTVNNPSFMIPVVMYGVALFLSVISKRKLGHRLSKNFSEMGINLCFIAIGLLVTASVDSGSSLRAEWGADTVTAALWYGLILFIAYLISDIAMPRGHRLRPPRKWGLKEVGRLLRFALSHSVGVLAVGMTWHLP